MARPTVKQVRRDVEELLKLAPIYRRYQDLEKKVKANMAQLKHTECEIAGLGRVFVSQSERVTVSPALAIEVLGEAMAGKVIVTKQSVPNELVKAFVTAGEISEQERDRLLAEAERTPVVSLHVRPLQ